MCKEAVSRRNFLRLLGAGVCGATIDYVANPSLSNLAFADPLSGMTNNGRLIVVFLDGGASNSILADYSGAFYDRFPTLHYKPEDSLPLNNAIGYHPSFSFLRSLHDVGQATVVNAAGYPNSNRSHSESKSIWDSGFRSMGAGRAAGWGARLVGSEGPFGGVVLSGSSLWGTGGIGNVRAANNIANSFNERNFSNAASQQAMFENLRDNLIASRKNYAPTNAEGKYVAASLESGIENAENLLESLTKPLPGGFTFPNTGFGRQCREAASLLLSDLGVKTLYLRLGGWDTHSNAKARVASLASQIDNGLEPLVRTLIAGGIWNSTALVTMSEFGRTNENGNAGDDHGYANAMFVASGAGLTKDIIADPVLSSGSARYPRDYNVDFRDVVGEIVTHLGYDRAEVFPERPTGEKLGLFS